MKKENKKRNTRKVRRKENKLKEKILEINLSKATIITSTIVILSIALITAGIIRTINESNKEKVEVEEEEEYSPVNWIESTEIGEDGNYKKVPVPKGYVASQIEGETTVNGGFVIYEDNYNGKSINWDEIIIKEDSSSTEDNSDASVVNEDDGEKEEGTDLEMPKTSSEVTPSEDESVEETAIFPENIPSEGEQPEQEEITGNDENVDSEEKSEEENGNKLEESAVSDEPVLNESEVAPQADEATGNEGETTEPVEPEAPTAEQQTKKNIFDLQKSVNQYVWVPVADISRICGVDANGKMWGKLYNFNNSGTSNNNWTETEGKIGITNKTGYREPDVTHYNTSYDTDINMKENMYGETQYEMLKKEMEQNYYETMKSIERYGGYYIGRYETGVEGRTNSNRKNGGKTVVRKMQYDNYSISYQTWYEAYAKNKELSGSNKNVKTSMIWGSLWDETLKWLVESGATTTGTETVASQPITYSLLTDSTTWGNHSNSSGFKYIPDGAEEPEATAEKASGGTRIPTGSAEYTKANNIYDMAGNVWEWTLEANSTNYRVYRGGVYNVNGTSRSKPVRYRSYNYPTFSYMPLGSRAALIIR